MKIVIVGGVAGGATAAARLRRLDEKAEIIMIERSGFISYANCGLPYYISGVIKEEKALTLQTPESFWRRFRIDARVKQEVLSIDPVGKTVQIKKLEDGTVYTESYDKLILSPGAKAIKPNLPGIESKRIVTLRTVEDTLKIRKFIESYHPQKAIVVGGGFIGLEAAENLMEAGIDTTLLQRDDQVLPPLDFDMASEVHAYLRGKGLDLRLNTLVTGFVDTKTEEDVNGKIIVQTEKQPQGIQSDLVVMAIGVTPETKLAKDAGLDLARNGAIQVNENMETSAADIYAVGDAVEVKHFVTGQKTWIALAGPANKQGRIVADRICGRDSSFSGSQGSSIIKLFDMTAASTGVNEKMAKSLGLSYDKVVTYSASHATYYPGATNMTIKTIFEPETGKILGAQIVGFEGVDKRLDVMATAIHAGMTAADLEELDLAYAPPYSSAKDPVNMAGFVIENVRSGVVKQYHWHDVESLQKEGNGVFLDVRTDQEFALGNITGAIHIPLDELRDHIGELDLSKPLYVNCHSGLRSYIACRILSENGFTCFNLSGGYRFYDYVLKEKKYDEVPEHPCGVKIQE